jgi:prepilin-type N-terminal cleavage/methylation domain-containing protein
MPHVSTGVCTYRRGFTLIELLVVIAILAVLIAILIPTLGRARTMAQRTVCAANLAGQGKAFAIYAAQNNDQLVNYSNFGGQWLHDTEKKNCDLLIGASLSDTQDATSLRKWFYCPSNFAANQDIAWQGLVMSGGVPGPPSGFRYLDYAYFNARNFGTAVGAGSVLTNGLARNSGAVPKLRFYTNLIKTQRASEAELVADEIITSTKNPPYDFSANNPGSGFHETSAHLKGTLPEGMNVLTYDGHVSWRRFPGNVAATTGNITPITQGPGYQAGGNQFMWIVDP